MRATSYHATVILYQFIMLMQNLLTDQSYKYYVPLLCYATMLPCIVVYISIYRSMFSRLSIVCINWLNPFSSLVLYEMFIFSVVCCLMHCARVAVVFKIFTCGAMSVYYNSVRLRFCQLTHIARITNFFYIFILCIRPSVSHTRTVLKHIVNLAHHLSFFKPNIATK